MHGVCCQFWYIQQGELSSGIRMRGSFKCAFPASSTATDTFESSLRRLATHSPAVYVRIVSSLQLRCKMLHVPHHLKSISTFQQRQKMNMLTDNHVVKILVRNAVDTGE